MKTKYVLTVSIQTDSEVPKGLVKAAVDEALLKNVRSVTTVAGKIVDVLKTRVRSIDRD